MVACGNQIGLPNLSNFLVGGSGERSYNRSLMKALLKQIHKIPSNELIELNKKHQFAHEECNEEPYLLADLFNDFIQDYCTCKINNRFLDQYNEQELDQVIQKYQLV